MKALKVAAMEAGVAAVGILARRFGHSASGRR